MGIPDRGPEFVGVVVAFLVLAILTTAGRCYVRFSIVKAFGTDDWFMIVALAFFITHSTWALLGVKYGTGRHFADLTHGNISKAMMFWWYCYSGYTATMIALKISIAVFLLRIAVERIHKMIIYGALVATTVPSVAFIFICIFQCKPISYFWVRYVDTSAKGVCINLGIIMKLTYTFSTISVLTDFIFTILPIFMVWRLNMKARSKWFLAPVFLLGSVASSAVVVRFAFVENFKDPDYLWATVDIAIWSTIEMGLGITAGNLATMRPLIRVLSQELGFSTGGLSNTTGRSQSVGTTLSAAGLRFNSRHRGCKAAHLDGNEGTRTDRFYALSELGGRKSDTWVSSDGAGVDMTPVYQVLPASTLIASYDQKHEALFAQANSKKIYQVYFDLLVADSTLGGDKSLFPGTWDVRLDQAYVWLYGAKVQPGLDRMRPLVVNLIRLSTTLNFSYVPLGVTDFARAGAAKKHSYQQFLGVFCGQLGVNVKAV
ncbi:Satratoxin biosynthesis SC3 cluster protein [Paramyrothecium foliicola]|nr:Satratoxin biosynthesis SC3 cluster protein [Paramyrothecium foliicola]